MHGMLEFLTNIIEAHWVVLILSPTIRWGSFIYQSHWTTSILILVLKGHCNVMCTNYWYLIKWSILYDFIMRTITKLTFFIDRHDIIISNITNYIICISNSSIKQLWNVYYTSNYIIMKFFLYFHEFLLF